MKIEKNFTIGVPSGICGILLVLLIMGSTNPDTTTKFEFHGFGDSLELTSPISESHWKYGSGDGSQEHWKYGSGVGSQKHWKYGSGYGSQEHWKYGSGYGSQEHWKYGSGITFDQNSLIDVYIGLFENGEEIPENFRDFIKSICPNVNEIIIDLN